MIYLTAPTRDEATAIGRALVREKLAACVNVLAGRVRSKKPGRSYSSPRRVKR
jgi:uncharacterized protein involved in tolerance to divalent cations